LLYNNALLAPNRYPESTHVKHAKIWRRHGCGLTQIRQ